MVDHAKLRDPNAEYTMRDLSSETMGLTNSRGDARDVEITDVQTTTMVDGNYPWILVRVYTDAGVVGTGESYWGGGDTAIIERMKPFLVGENPLDIDRLYEHLVQKMSGEGSISGKTISAISGIEIALHDVAGKILDVPVAYRFVGGKYRDEVRVYCDLHTEDEANPQACAEEAERVVENLGYDAIKFDLDVPSGHEKDRANRHLRNPDRPQGRDRESDDRSRRRPRRRRLRLPLVLHGRLGQAPRRSPRTVRRLGLEDPVPPENHDVQENVTKSTTTPIGVGENVYRKYGQRTLLEPQAVDIIAPDLPRVGGMRETRKIADLAEMYYIPVAMHNVSSPIGTMASAQVATAIPELARARVPLLPKPAGGRTWSKRTTSSRRAAWRFLKSLVSA